MDSTVVREWLTVLSRRDVGLLVCISGCPKTTMTGRGALLARFAQWWVAHVMVRRSRPDQRGRRVASNGGDRQRGTGQHKSSDCGGAFTPASPRPVTLDADAHVVPPRPVK